MSDRLLFVYDNLKVTFNPGDAPYGGFDILAGEAQCATRGTLFDLGYNAGYIPEGKTQVKGQIWSTFNPSLIDEIEDFIYSKSNVRRLSIYVTISEGDEKLVVPATVFALENIPRTAKKVDSGFWLVRSYQSR